MDSHLDSELCSELVLEAKSDSILTSMSDDALSGKISDAVKRDISSDSCPVFGHQMCTYNDDRESRMISYDNNSSWYEREVITVDRLLADYHTNRRPLMNISNSSIALSSLHTRPTTPLDKDIALTEASVLLQQYMVKNEDSDLVATKEDIYAMMRTNAEKAVDLIEQYALTGFHHLCRDLVYFPDLLERFLQVQRNNGAIISEDDIGCMIARCIEGGNYRYSKESMAHLLIFKGEIPIEIKLLPHLVNADLYAIAKTKQVQDMYYDATMTSESYQYKHLDVVAKAKTGHFTGFRDAYHALIYGAKTHMQALIVHWDLWDEDETADAARKYFGLEPKCPIEMVIDKINTRTAGL